MISLNRSPGHTVNEFYSFIINFEKPLADISSCNLHYVMVASDFNAKSTNWSINDTTTSEKAQLDSFMSLYGLKQLITELTHILENSFSCIDLFFTKHSDGLMEHIQPYIPGLIIK